MALVVATIQAKDEDRCPHGESQCWQSPLKLQPMRLCGKSGDWSTVKDRQAVSAHGE